MSSLRFTRRRSAILPTLVIVAVLIVVFAIFTSVWTDRLWYGSFGYASVFSKMLLTKIGLFVSFGLLMATSVVANAAIAYRLRPRLGAQVPTSPLAERYSELLESRFVRVMVALGLVVGLFAGSAASGHVLEYLAWRNSTSFNVTDPRFGLDVGFFVFDYPWWRFVLSFAFAAFVFSAIVAAIVHYMMGGLRFSGPRRGGSTCRSSSPLDPGWPGRAGEGFQLLVRPVRAGDRTLQQAVHRHLLHRRQCDGHRQDDLGHYRRNLCAAVPSPMRCCAAGWCRPSGWSCCCCRRFCLGWSIQGLCSTSASDPTSRSKSAATSRPISKRPGRRYGVDKVEITDYSAKTTATAVNCGPTPRHCPESV